MISHQLNLISTVSALCMGIFSQAQAHADIVIGTSSPLKGPYVQLGEQLKRGVEQAIADINQAGGINGEKLILNAQDDGCDVTTASRVAETLIAQQSKLVVGPYCSNAVMATAKSYESKDIVVITPAASSIRINETTVTTLFRLTARDDAQAAFAAQALANIYKNQKIAILNDGTKNAVALAQTFKTKLNSAGVSEVLFASYAPGQNDYPELVQQILQVDTNAVYVAGQAADAGAILRALKDLASPAHMIGSDSLLVEQFWSVAGTSGEGTLATLVADPMQAPAAKDLVSRFQAENFVPQGATLRAYAAVQAYAAAASATHSTDGKLISQWLRAGHAINTVLGQISFDASGELVNPAFSWYRWSMGKFAQVPSPATP